MDGATLAERAWEAIAWCDERLAFGKTADALPLPFPVEDDHSAIRAPLAGLVAGLRAASHNVVVVLPVDCPFATPEILRKLAAACEDAAVPQTGPLPGAYHRRTLPALEQRTCRQRPLTTRSAQIAGRPCRLGRTSGACQRQYRSRPGESGRVDGASSNARVLGRRV